MTIQFEANLSVNQETGARIDQARALAATLATLAGPNQTKYQALHKSLGLLQGSDDETIVSLEKALGPIMRELANELAPSNLPMVPVLQDVAKSLTPTEPGLTLTGEAKEGKLWTRADGGAVEKQDVGKGMLFSGGYNDTVLVTLPNAVRQITCNDAWRLRDLSWLAEKLTAGYPEKASLRVLASSLMSLDPEETAQRLRNNAACLLGDLITLSTDLKESFPEMSAVLAMAKPDVEAIASMIVNDTDDILDSTTWVYQHAGVQALAAMQKGDMSTGQLASSGGLKQPSQGGAFKRPQPKAALALSTEMKLWKMNPSPFAPMPEAKPARPDAPVPTPPVSIASKSLADMTVSFPVRQMLEAAPPNSVGLQAVAQVLRDAGHTQAADGVEKQRLEAELLYQKALASVRGAAEGLQPAGEINKQQAAPTAEQLAKQALASAFPEPAKPTDKKEPDPYEGMTPLVKYVMQKHMTLIKGDEERYVMGVVLEPETIDAQNDIISTGTIRTAAHKFMEEFQNLGLQHQWLVNGAVKILESYIAPATFKAGDQTIVKDSWVLAVRVVDDRLWDMVKNNQLTGFSIGGVAYRVPEASQAAAA